MNIDKINIIKRDQVRELCKIADESGIVKRIVIFGSSVRDDCTEESDVDFWISFSCDVQDIRIYNFGTKIGKVLEYNYDMLIDGLLILSDAMKHSVFDKGVTVYER